MVKLNGFIQSCLELGSRANSIGQRMLRRDLDQHGLFLGFSSAARIAELKRCIKAWLPASDDLLPRSLEQGRKATLQSPFRIFRMRPNDIRYESGHSASPQQIAVAPKIAPNAATKNTALWLTVRYPARKSVTALICAASISAGAWPMAGRVRSLAFGPRSVMAWAVSAVRMSERSPRMSRTGQRMRS